MFIVKHTGLVPVISLKWGGKPFGVSPAAATKGILAGEMQAIEPPYGIEAMEVPDPVAEKVVPQKPEGGVIDIPTDWADQHPLKQIKWAMQINGGEKIVLTAEDEAADVKKTDKAAEIIRDYLEQRAAADA